MQNKEQKPVEWTDILPKQQFYLQQKTSIQPIQIPDLISDVNVEKKLLKIR